LIEFLAVLRVQHKAGNGAVFLREGDESPEREEEGGRRETWRFKILKTRGIPPLRTTAIFPWKEV
jgi:hypothetical protein